MLKVVMVTEHDDGAMCFHLNDGSLFVMDIYDDIETVVKEVDAIFQDIGYNPYIPSEYSKVETAFGKGKVVFKDEGAIH